MDVSSSRFGADRRCRWVTAAMARCTSSCPPNIWCGDIYHAPFSRISSVMGVDGKCIILTGARDTTWHDDDGVDDNGDIPPKEEITMRITRNIVNAVRTFERVANPFRHCIPSCARRSRLLMKCCPTALAATAMALICAALLSVANALAYRWRGVLGFGSKW